MLKKLLKYDLKSIFKFLVIFYSLALFFGLLTRIFLNIENSLIMNIIGQICSGTTISMMFSIVINNLMRLWVRFKQNLYGDESYLTHTLPIDKKTLYQSKIITAIITFLVSFGVLALVMFVAGYVDTLKNILLPVTNILDGSLIKYLLIFVFIMYLEIACISQFGYAGIILGHRKNNAKVGYSILYGFVLYTISQMFVLIVLFLISLFNKDLMNLFITNEILNIKMLNSVIYMASFIYVIIFIAVYFINIKLFKKGVNVE